MTSRGQRSGASRWGMVNADSSGAATHFHANVSFNSLTFNQTFLLAWCQVNVSLYSLTIDQMFLLFDVKWTFLFTSSRSSNCFLLYIFFFACSLWGKRFYLFAHLHMIYLLNIKKKMFLFPSRNKRSHVRHCCLSFACLLSHKRFSLLVYYQTSISFSFATQYLRLQEWTLLDYTL